MSKVNNTRPAGTPGSRIQNELNAATVQDGETSLADVAARLKVSLKSLADANPQITNPKSLKAGQDVRLPGADKSPFLASEAAPRTPDTGGQPGAMPLPSRDSLQKAFVQAKLKEAAGTKTILANGGAGVLAFKPDAEIPPATISELAADKIARRVEGRLNSIPDIKSENYPELTPEEEALADLGSGIAKYKEYADYAKTALETLKVMPDSPQKQALMRTLGKRLDSVAGFIDGVSGKLKTFGKYANYAKDAVGFAAAARDLSASLKKMDFSDPASVERMMDSLGKANDRAQGFFSGMRDYLISRGTAAGAQAGLALSYATIMITAGIELGRAGVKAEKAYFDRLDRVSEALENGTYGMAKQLPHEPAPLQTYEDLRNAELKNKRELVGNAVAAEFGSARQDLANAFDATRRSVRDKFDEEVFPKTYRQHRGSLIKELEKRLSNSGNLDRDTFFREADTIGRLLGALESHKNADSAGGTGLTKAEIQEEIALFRRLSPNFAPSDAVRTGREMVKTMHEDERVETSLDRLYKKGLDAFYERNGAGESALDKLYDKYGLSEKAIRQAVAQKIRELGLE